ncbi:MAG: TRAP transporter fused permease subunit [Chloroflexi bacterium]|nr:TRAP transporter fused permease subunit [Chloroflexota bacterium]
MSETSHGPPVELAGQRRLSGMAASVVRIMAVTLPALTLAVAFTGWFDTMTRRSGHLMLAIPLVFLLYPAWARSRDRITALDWTLFAASVAAFGWIVLERERLLWRFVYVDPLSPIDLLLGPVAVLVVLEATRRILGTTLVAVTGAFLLYAFAGPWLPGILGHKGVAPALLVEHLYLVPEGLFNQITGIMATYLLVFLTFGTFLRAAGGDRIFMNLAIGLAGGRDGGPAKAAVVASALMGSVSGSTIANVVTTGTVTIPLMKRCGYRAHEAAAIETAAGTGGAMMPPVMGAGVFIMAELTGIPLLTILLYSVLPAVLYFGSLYAYVHLKARKRGLAALDEGDTPSVMTTLAHGWHLLAPLGILVYLLAQNYSPFYSAAVSVVSLVAMSWLRPETRLTPRRLLLALEATTRGALVLSATSASAAVIMGVITITGLMLKVTSVVLALAGGSLLAGILLIAVVASIMGMGLPITSTYIIVATLGASALAELGAPLLAAHLIIFWFSQTATVTPPVCMTAFVAAAIAGARPMRTGFEAMRAAKALYLLPLMFAFTHLLGESLGRVLFDAAAGMVGLVLVQVVLEGWYRGALTIAGRVLAGVSASAFFLACFTSSLVGTAGWFLIALALLVALSVLQRRRTAFHGHRQAEQVST